MLVSGVIWILLLEDPDITPTQLQGTFYETLRFSVGVYYDASNSV